MNFLRRHWNTSWIAIWHWQLDLAKLEDDYPAIDHAIDRLYAHEGRLARYQGK